MPVNTVSQKKNGLLDAIRELVFGLEDGLVSTLGAVAGVAAGTQDSKIVILTGAVIIVVESLSMAAGSYLSNKSHREFLQKRVDDERREIEEKPEEETEELREMYRERGFTEEEIEIVVKRITSDKDLWLEEMVAKELEIGQADLRTPKSHAMVMGLAYVAGGSVPVIPFLLLPVSTAIPVSVVATVIALFFVGYWKGHVTGLDKAKSGFEMMLVAMAASGLGYVIGTLLGAAFGLKI